MSDEQKGSVSEMAVRKPLRPALVVSQQTSFAYPFFLNHLMLGLADESIPVALICPPDFDADRVAPAVEIIRYPAFDLPFMQFKNNRILVETLRRFRPSVIHSLCHSQAPITRHLAKQLNLPYILSINLLQKRFNKISISPKRCAKIIVPCNSIAANVAELYPEFDRRIERVNMGAFVADEEGCFCQAGRIPSVVTTHSLERVEDFEKLFNAVRHLAIDGYEFMLFVIGSGKVSRKLRRRIAQLGLLQIVITVPRIQSWRSVLTAADIFIQPQILTEFNGLLLEAMSVGTAVAGCKGGVDDLLIEDKTAVIFDPDDELSIYAGLQRLLDTPEKTRQLARQAQDHLRQTHTVSQMLSDILRVYHDTQVCVES